MLRKLLKYDLKAYGMYLLVGYGVYAVTTLLFSLMMRWISGESALLSYAAGYYTASDENLEMLIVFAMITISILWIFSIIGLLILTYVLIVRRFYMNMVSDQGYLTLTLPVSARMHMLSKTISGWLLQVLTVAVLAAGWGIALWALRGNEIWINLFHNIGSILQDFLDTYGVLYLLNLLLKSIHGILLVYFSICVGQLCNKHKVWGSIGTYLGINMVVNVLSWIAAFVAAMYDALDTARWLMESSLNGIGILWSLAQILLYFFLGAWILERKANLE